MDKSRDVLYRVVFESDTKAGKLFDVVLILIILFSATIIVLESVQSLSSHFSHEFEWLEWIFTAIFTIEFLVRIYVHPNPRLYLFSFYGIIDLLAILPSYLGLIWGAGQSLIVIRLLRLLRVLRVFKLTKLVEQGRIIVSSLVASREKLIVFVFGVLLLTFVFGTVMYYIEGSSNSGFDNIPRSIYWCIVTITTVGYGDISPQTSLGQLLASILMLLGYAIIAVPTGIVTSELIRKNQKNSESKLKSCQACKTSGHDADARFCKNCGSEF